MESSLTSPVTYGNNGNNCVSVCEHARVQLYLTLCSPMDCSPPGSSAHGTFWARIREGGAISYTRGSSPSRDWTPVSWVSCIGRQITSASWEVHKHLQSETKPKSTGWVESSVLLLLFIYVLFINIYYYILLLQNCFCKIQILRILRYCYR